MIYIDSLSKSYNGSCLFSDVNISLKKGMRIGLVGANGTGKTTLLRILIGEDDFDTGNIQKDKNITIGYLPQDIISGSGDTVLEEAQKSFPELKKIENELSILNKQIKKGTENKKTVEKIGELHDRYEVIGGWKIEQDAKKILSGLGFKELQFGEKLNTFSGGWRMRVALASILLKKPDIIFLDEPTNHLDLEATIWLETFLNDWKGSLVLISHDRTFLDKSVNHILEIELRKVFLFHGNYSSYIKEKSIRAEQHRNAFNNQQKKIKDTERFIERFRYKNTKATQVQSRIKALEKMDKIEALDLDNKVMQLTIPNPGRSPLKIISCNDLGKSYGENRVFNNLNLTIERKQKIGLVGHNGAGKTTLLKLFAGVIEPSEGKVENANNINISYYAQHQLELLDSNDTIYQTIAKVSSNLSETEIRTYLGSFLFSGDDIDKYNKVLSGGEKARVALARMLLIPANILLLDEPTNHLDMKSRNVLENALRNYEGSIVCISHDRFFLNRITNLTYEVGNYGVHVYEGNYDYYYWKKNQKEESDVVDKDKAHLNSLNKISYKERKKNKNRLSWIKRRIKNIDKDIDSARAVIQNKKNIDNFILLQKKTEEIENFEKEYLSLLEEEDTLIRNI